ncbi:MAG: hypothetical protein L3K10_07800 [Thermoplasmata archaeon]|nr:hypothetical protein [Thermoplasmata archaeon]
MGEIPTAFEVTLDWGPVRIAFTDRRIIVIWTGPHHFLPSRRSYFEWKRALPPLPPARTVGSPWVQGKGEIAWEFALSTVAAIRASQEHGLGTDPDVCDLAVETWWNGDRASTMGPPPWAGRSDGGFTLVWRVPGESSSLLQFLRKMPVARVVDRVLMSPLRS